MPFIRFFEVLGLWKKIKIEWICHRVFCEPQEEDDEITTEVQQHGLIEQKLSEHSVGVDESDEDAIEKRLSIVDVPSLQNNRVGIQNHNLKARIEKRKAEHQNAMLEHGIDEMTIEKNSLERETEQDKKKQELQVRIEKRKPNEKK